MGACNARQPGTMIQTDLFADNRLNR